MSAVAVWRICFNGDLRLTALPYGSTLGPGRWHVPPPIGLPVVYAASNRALAQLEKRVHANGVAPVQQALVRLDLPARAVLPDAVRDFKLEAPRWRTDEGYTQEFGMAWLARGAELGLWVPSVVEPQERNLLLNPAHAMYAQIALSVEVAEFSFDPRLF